MAYHHRDKVHYYSEAEHFGRLCQAALTTHKIEKSFKIGLKTGRNRKQMQNLQIKVLIGYLYLDS